MNGSCLINIISEANILTSKKFEVVVESTPLVSIDFVVRAPDKKILLGKWVNRPAQGYWFVLGRRILKDESVKLTFKRLLDFELAIRPKDISIRTDVWHTVIVLSDKSPLLEIKSGPYDRQISKKYAMWSSAENREEARTVFSKIKECIKIN